VENETRQESPDFQAATDEISSRLQQEKQSAAEALHDARDEITRKAGDYTSEAKETLFKQAEGAQRDISSNLAAFGGALRAASEHLANAQQNKASKFVLDAAGGLESLSGSLKTKPFEEVLDDLRTFGKANSGALISGSVLAGLALGRFLKSSASSAKSDMSAAGDTSDAGTYPQTNSDGDAWQPGSQVND